MRRHREKSKPDGFTLIEMLVVVTLFGLIMAVITTLFTKGTQVYRHGESHIELQRSGRHIAARLTPYLATMYDAYVPGSEPILVPPGVHPDNTFGFVRFLTTEDWLGEDYDLAARPPTVSTLSAQNSSDLRRHIYQIGLNQEQDLILNRLTTLTPLDPDIDPNFRNPTFVPTPTDTRAIVRAKNRNTDNPEVFEDRNGNPAFEFLYPRRNLLLLRYSISKNTRGPNNQLMRITEPFRITFNLPTKII